MVLSAWAPVLSSPANVPPSPPLVAPLALAGLAVLFAAAWVVSSYRAGARSLGPLTKPYSRTRRTNRVLRYVFGFGISFATAAALLTIFVDSSAYGRETERLERVGYGRYEVPVVRLAGEPVFHEGDEDRDPSYTTDLVLRIPYDSGPREVTVRGLYTRLEPPVPGRTKVEVYFAPLDPGVPVVEDGTRDGRLFGMIALAALVGPWVLIVGGGLTGYMNVHSLHRLRRFEPGVHLPALGILLTGLVLLLPVALEFEAAGLARPLAALAALTPGLAFTWMVKRA